MQIGIDIRNIGKKRTGDEAVFFGLTKSLAMIDDHNEYLLFTDITNPETIKQIRVSLGITDRRNFQIVSLESRNRFFWNLLVLPKYLRKNPVDIYLTQYITPFFVPRRTKIVTIIHDISFLIYPELIRFSDLLFLKLLIPLSLRRAEKIVGVSRFTRDEIRKHYNIAEQKLAWIHNAVDGSFAVDPNPEKIKRVREKYDLPERFILYMGTLQPRKNLPVLIKAYADLSESARSATRLVLAGGRGRNFDARINAEIKRSRLENNVVLPGFISEEDKPAVFAASAIFCNPSLYEGFGITVLEAMTLGVPVIASDIPPHREVAGNSIIYHTPEDQLDLAKKISTVLEDKALREKLVMEEMAISKDFSWKKSAAKMLEIFQNIASERD